MQPAHDARTTRPVRALRAHLRRHDLAGAYLAILLLTWAVWVPRALGAPTGAMGQASTWAPAVAVVAWTSVAHGPTGVREIGRRVAWWRVRWWWYPAVLAGPWMFSLAVAGVAAMLGVPPSQAQPATAVTPVVSLLLLLAVLALTDGLGEEVAWRGYLLPRLLGRHGC